ncbi:MAG: hypothetical protein RLP02_17040 [Coleofasciculus sp. C2-GNP5-27]|uniref:hypothetical protein n=1 Tax=Coleofasciculus sp. B1-GNL1-01 TaxID=3068484 RepID=UPI0032F10CA3
MTLNLDRQNHGYTGKPNRLAVDYVLELEEYRLPNRVHGTVAIAKPNQYINVSLCHSDQGGYSDDTNRY